MKRNLWFADSVRFYVQGENLQYFVNLAAAQGIRLAHLRWQKGSFTAQGQGRDYPRLQRIASQGNWTLSVAKRQGPGQIIEFFVHRPGLFLGGILFFALIGVMSRMVWAIDFGTLSEASRERMRTLLDECGICEGVFLGEEALQAAQYYAAQQSDLFGWVSLNFAGGCLYIEASNAQTQTMREAFSQTPLYAKTAGQILAVESESGFAVVTPGQVVAQGDLLVDTKRIGRDEKEIFQESDGRILARCEKSYSCSQPLQIKTTFLTGRHSSFDQWCAFGIRNDPGQEVPGEENSTLVEWIPFQLGRLRLPGSICRVTVWEQTDSTVTYSLQQAQALAQRDCRSQLFAEFPDAVIESETCDVVPYTDSVFCTITYRFRANIATLEP